MESNENAIFCAQFLSSKNIVTPHICKGELFVLIKLIYELDVIFY